MNSPVPGPAAGSDRRRAPRVPVRIPLKFRLVKSPAGEAPEKELHNGNNLVINMSRSGFLISTKNYLEVGSVIQIEFPLEAFKTVVRSLTEVVRANNYNFTVNGRFEYGLRLVSMHPQQREMLFRFLDLSR